MNASSPKARFEISTSEPFVASCHNLEEQVRLLASKRQITDLVDDQQFRRRDDPVHHLLGSALAAGRPPA